MDQGIELIKLQILVFLQTTCFLSNLLCFVFDGWLLKNKPILREGKEL